MEISVNLEMAIKWYYPYVCSSVHQLVLCMCLLQVFQAGIQLMRTVMVGMLTIGQQSSDVVSCHAGLVVLLAASNCQ